MEKNMEHEMEMLYIGFYKDYMSCSLNPFQGVIPRII